MAASLPGAIGSSAALTWLAAAESRASTLQEAHHALLARIAPGMTPETTQLGA